jgi:hypothetical protein
VTVAVVAALGGLVLALGGDGDSDTSDPSGGSVARSQGGQGETGVDAASTLPAGEAEPGTYLVPLVIVMNGDARPYEATVVEQDGGFCVQNIAEDSYAGAGVPDEGAFNKGAGAGRMRREI